MNARPDPDTLVGSDLEHLCSGLDAIYEKSSKGVHADITIEEARLTIIQAYIFIGEIARIDTNTEQHKRTETISKSTPPSQT